MSIDLQTPIAVGRSAAEAVQRHAVDAVEAARSVDVQAPVDAVAHARKRARRAAKRVERRIDHASKRAAERVHDESRRVARATNRPRRGRKALMVVLLVAGGAAVVAALAKRMQQMKATETVPDPFGTAVRAAEPAHRHDTNSVTTG